MNKFLSLLVIFSCFALQAAEYTLKLPIPSRIQINETNGILTIDLHFKPSKASNAQMNRKIDRKHAEKICREGLRQYMNVTSGTIQYSQMEQKGAPNYSDNDVTFHFSVPKSAIKVVKTQPTTVAAKGKGNSTVSKVQQDNNLSQKKIGLPMPEIQTIQASDASNTSSTETTSPKTCENTNNSIPSATQSPSSSVEDVNLLQGGTVATMSSQLIKDDEIKNMSSLGYSIRLKCDFQAMFELKHDDLNALNSQADFDALVGLVDAFKDCQQNFSAEAINAKYKYDINLTARDLKEITDYSSVETGKLQQEILDSFKLIKDKVQKELVTLKQDLESELEAKINEDVNSDILTSVNDSLQQLEQLESNFK